MRELQLNYYLNFALVIVGPRLVDDKIGSSKIRSRFMWSGFGRLIGKGNDWKLEHRCSDMRYVYRYVWNSLMCVSPICIFCCVFTIANIENGSEKSYYRIMWLRPEHLWSQRCAIDNVFLYNSPSHKMRVWCIQP